jgi:hypothetical protein
VGVNNNRLDFLVVPGPRNELLSAIRLDSVEEDEFTLMDSVAKQFHFM